MSAWRVLGAVALLAVLAPAGRAQTCNLAESVKAGDCFRIKLDMKLAGEMRVHKSDRVLPLKLEATASHEYPERVLLVGTGNAIQKTARVYETATATITVAGDRTERALRPERRLAVAQHQQDQGVVYSPAGALTRPELDLVGYHFDTLAIPQLLPGKEVSVGDTWKVPNGAVQAVCNFEGLTEQALTGKLESVQDDVATFTLTGTATGIDVGALAKLKVEATGRFDLKAKRVVALEWKQKDDRDQGPASPAVVAETTVTLSRQSVEQPEGLSDVALVSVPEGLNVPPAMLQVDYRDPQGRFSMLHGREWQSVSETKDHTVLRLMDRGDFVAQVTITPWTNAGKGKHTAPEDFKAKVNDTAGWQPEQELQAGEVPDQAEGRWAYRLSQLGKMDGLSVLQNFYLVAAPGGEQVVLLFTMTPKQAEKLGARDLAFVGSLEVPAATGK
jgi:hypothetical protein